MRRYAAAKAMKDTGLMELYLTELFPEEVDGGVMFAALDQPGLRLEVALPFGFDQDPKATSERLAATTEEIQRLLGADGAESGRCCWSSSSSGSFPSSMESRWRSWSPRWRPEHDAGLRCPSSDRMAV